MENYHNNDASNINPVHADALRARGDDGCIEVDEQHLTVSVIPERTIKCSKPAAEAAEALSPGQRAALILPALGILVPGIIPT